jgi:hypothetical protein
MPRPDGYASRRELEALRRQIAAISSRESASSGTMANQLAAVAVQSPRVRIALGQIGLAVAVGGTLDVPITWSTPFPRDTYQVDVTPATGLIGRGSCAAKPGTQTASGLTVTVRADLLVSLGAQFIAIGICSGP